MSGAFRLLRGRLTRRLPQRRSIVTLHQEPPLDSSIPERPCSIALVQDRGLYGEISAQFWEDQCLEIIPTQLGMPFASLEVDAQENSLATDIASLSNPLVVLVARGPLVSWWAQLYLESYSLAGLVLVDPLPLEEPNPDLVDQLIESSADAFLDGVYLNHLYEAQNRPLLLEPGAVPMMVVQSRKDAIFSQGANQTADRHRFVAAENSRKKESSTGEVPILTLEDDYAIESMLRDSIAPWIESQVL
jgi:hypothetical protein